MSVKKIIKIVCPNCHVAAEPVKPRTFDCPKCRHHTNFTIGMSGKAKFTTLGRKNRGMVRVTVRIDKWHKEQIDNDVLSQDEIVRRALDKYYKRDYI